MTRHVCLCAANTHTHTNTDYISAVCVRSVFMFAPFGIFYCVLKLTDFLDATKCLRQKVDCISSTGRCDRCDKCDRCVLKLGHLQAVFFFFFFTEEAVKSVFQVFVLGVCSVSVHRSDPGPPGG